MLQANTKLVLDLSRLRFVDSSGLGAMLSCLRQLSAKNGDLKLCGMSKQVRAAFRTGAHASDLRYLRHERRGRERFQPLSRADEQAEAPYGDSVSAIEESLRRHARYSLGKAWRDLSPTELFNAVALSVRDRLMDGMLETEERYRREDPKRSTTVD